MTCSYFDQLTETRQTDVVWESGAFLARRTQGFHNILLFQIDGFYIEVWYHSHFNVIIKILSFNDTEQLEPYLNAISIAALIE